MKKQGRSPVPFTDKELTAINEYLTTDKSLIEVGERYGMSGPGLRYKVKKYKKQKDEERNG